VTEVVTPPDTWTCLNTPDSTRIVMALFASNRMRMMLFVPPLPLGATPTWAYTLLPVAS
jgi:hypothetical protein